MKLLPDDTRRAKRRPETMSVEELAEMLNRNRMGIYADLKRGLIPHRKLGNRYIISRTAVRRWLEGSDGEAA